MEVLHVAGANFPIDGVYTGSMDSDQDFRKSRRGARGIFESEYFRAAVLMNAYCFHVFHFRYLLA
jgi:hypothetical protein